MKTKKTTIKDIAGALGYSVSTVSRALTNSWDVSKETRELVLRKAEEMNYRPNTMARSLVTRKSRTIAMIVPDLFRSTYFTTLARHIQEKIIDNGYQLILLQSNESPEEERRILKGLMNYNIDGMIISTSTDSEYNKETYEEIIREGIALVFVSRICQTVRAPKIVTDNIAMAEEIVNHLISEGCRRIAFFSGPDGVIASTEREEGYRKALENNGIGFEEDLVVASGLSQENGYDSACAMLDEGVLPDAIFAFNDNVAFGVMKALKERHIPIPVQIAVAGFSNSFASTIIEPSLTTSDPPLKEMGYAAVEQIFKQLEGFEPTNETITIPSELIIRDSSRKASAK